MSKIDFSNLQGLKHPSIIEALANMEEQYYINGWDFVKSEVLRLSELAWKADLNGDKQLANKHYTGINIYFYLIYLNNVIAKDMQRKGLSEINEEIRVKYKLDCVDKNLTCLGNIVKSPLYNTWQKIIDGTFGEFNPCDFVTEEFTQSFGYNFGLCEETLTQQIVPIEIDTNDGPDIVDVEVDSPVDRTPPNVRVYGLLYNWFAVNTGNLAPIGFHVPSDAEWTELVNYLGGMSVAGGKLKEIGTIRWISPNVGATDEFGFTALPGGSRRNDGVFTNIEYSSFLWSSTQSDVTTAWFRILDNYSSEMFGFNFNKGDGMSIRCVRNLNIGEESLTDGTYLDPITDIDGNEYKVVKIGTQAWMADNLKTTKYNNGVVIPNVQDNTEWLNMSTGAYCSYNNE